MCLLPSCCLNREKPNTASPFLDHQADISSCQHGRRRSSSRRICQTTKVTLRVRAGWSRTAVPVRFQSTCRDTEMERGRCRRSGRRLRIQTRLVEGQKTITRALSQTHVAPTSHRLQIAVKHSAGAGTPDPLYPMAARPGLAGRGGVLQLEKF